MEGNNTLTKEQFMKLYNITKEGIIEWYNKGFQMSQDDDVSCIEEAILNTVFEYDWQEKAFYKGYISGC